MVVLPVEPRNSVERKLLRSGWREMKPNYGRCRKALFESEIKNFVRRWHSLLWRTHAMKGANIDSFVEELKRLHWIRRATAGSLRV